MSRLRWTDSKQTVQSAPFVIPCLRWVPSNWNASHRCLCNSQKRKEKKRKTQAASDFSSPLRMLTGARRLTLTDWLRLWESAVGRAPLDVGMDDCKRLSMLLCGDKRTDGYQINGALLSVKVGLGLFNLWKQVTAADPKVLRSNAWAPANVTGNNADAFRRSFFCMT